MQIWFVVRFCVGLSSAALLLGACKKDDKLKATPERATSAAPSASSSPSEPPAEPCKAGATPTVLGSTPGSVYGFAADGTHLYYASWQSLGGRGDLGKVRKDGGGGRNLKSLSLEPRGLVVDATLAFYTSGIRLFSVPKEGGDEKLLGDKFSSQSITHDLGYVYGVPGDYGPYDRLIRLEKATGTTKELDVSERPETKDGPTGFSAIAVDASGIYVTDSGGNRVLRFELDRAKPKTIAARQDKAYDLAIDEANVYFTLAQRGHLMKVAKAGGPATQLASGLATRARIAADGNGIFTTLPQSIVKVPTSGGKPSELSPIPANHTVEAITIDDKCVYWAQRDPESQKAVIYARSR